MHNRITITLHGNEAYLGFHANKVVSENYISRISGMEEDKTAKRVSAFYSKLLKVKGVTSVTINKYEVSIERGTAFDWPELAPKLLDMIAKFLSFSEFEVRIKDERPTRDYDEDGCETSARFNATVDIGITPSNPYALQVAA